MSSEFRGFPEQGKTDKGSAVFWVVFTFWTIFLVVALILAGIALSEAHNAQSGRDTSHRELHSGNGVNVSEDDIVSLATIRPSSILANDDSKITTNPHSVKIGPGGILIGESDGELVSAVSDEDGKILMTVGGVPTWSLGLFKLNAYDENSSQFDATSEWTTTNVLITSISVDVEHRINLGNQPTVSVMVNGRLPREALNSSASIIFDAVDILDPISYSLLGSPLPRGSGTVASDEILTDFQIGGCLAQIEENLGSHELHINFALAAIPTTGEVRFSCHFVQSFTVL